MIRDENRITISDENAPAAVGPYCHAGLCGDTLYGSGLLGLIPVVGVLAEGLEGQTRQMLDNLGAVLPKGGLVEVEAVAVK